MLCYHKGTSALIFHPLGSLHTRCSCISRDFLFPVRYTVHERAVVFQVNIFRGGYCFYPGNHVLLGLYDMCWSNTSGFVEGDGWCVYWVTFLEVRFMFI